MMESSIRARLLGLVLLSVTMVWSIALVWSYRQTIHEVREWDNARLVQIAALLAPLNDGDLARVTATGIDVRNEYSRDPQPEDELDGDKLPRTALVEVRAANGSVIARSAGFDAIAAHARNTANAEGFTSFEVDGAGWHRYATHDAVTGRTTTLLEPTLTHSDLVSGVAGRIARPMLVALPFLAILIWVSIGRSLAPLAALSRAVRVRDATRLDPIEIDPGPLEVRPLVVAINDLMSRLRGSFARERAFTSDAAHELKTPLAAIKVQAQVALLAEDPAQLRLAMERVVQGVDRSTRLAEQLLLLARLDETEKIKASDVDVYEIACEAIAARHADFATKHMTPSLEGTTRSLVHADATLLRILIDNLLDNSIKYCQPGGRVEVRIRHDARTLVLTVADDGPGVSPAERERITDRFFRGTNVTARGSGLGLSIVARIAAYFGAALQLGSGIASRGLAVDVTFASVADTGTHVARSADERPARGVDVLSPHP
ncbi:ATP-binding protein [Paraburkholderia phosphatilytica]|uniref:ATP-binding protein n=1 Tax=Paraburkholderia phosphatilytica TaxID=2282883 RepID=UPI000E4EF976|nr:ATP-binding protein [Paraburkholderia phosphatilytica]